MTQGDNAAIVALSTKFAELSVKFDALTARVGEFIDETKEHFEKIETRSDDCRKHCDDVREPIYERVRTLEIEGSKLSAKMSFVWGGVGTLIGGILMVGVTLIVQHLFGGK